MAIQHSPMNCITITGTVYPALLIATHQPRTMDIDSRRSLPYRAVRYPFKIAIQRVWQTIINNLDYTEAWIENYAQIYTQLDPQFQTADIKRRDDGLWELTVRKNSYRFPDIANNATNLNHGTPAKILMYGFDADPMVSRYEDNQVEIETDDVVVDVGGYIGMFAAYSSSVGASNIHSIEPTPDAYRCLEHNTAEDDSIHPYQLGIWSENGTMQLDQANDPTDNSLNEEGAFDVPVVTIEKFARDNKLDTIDFLKVDVEGLELSVLKGIGDTRVRKIGVDAGEGKDSNPSDVLDLLTDYGYDVWRHEHLVYGIYRN